MRKVLANSYWLITAGCGEVVVKAVSGGWGRLWVIGTLILRLCRASYFLHGFWTTSTNLLQNILHNIKVISIDVFKSYTHNPQLPTITTTTIFNIFSYRKINLVGSLGFVW